MTGLNGRLNKFCMLYGHYITDFFVKRSFMNILMICIMNGDQNHQLSGQTFGI